MQTELKMNAHNNAYTIVSLVFFFPYAIFQPPATVAIREIGPRVFLAIIIFLWGAVMIVSTCLVCVIRANYSVIWICEDMANHGCSSSHSWMSRSWILPWLRLPPEYLVSKVRASKTECCLLPHRQHGVRLCWCSCVWFDAAQWTCWFVWLEVDLYREFSSC